MSKKHKLDVESQIRIIWTHEEQKSKTWKRESKRMRASN